MFYFGNYKNKKCRQLFFLLLFIATGAFSQTQKYELNDPRNPDCPCHKAQKQAEQEYAQLNPAIDKTMLNAEKDSSPINEAVPEKSDVTAKTVATHVSAAAGKNKHKNKMSGIRKLTFRYFRKHRGLKKMHTDYSVCFHNW